MVSAQPNKNIQEKLVQKLMELPNQAVILLSFLNIYTSCFNFNNNLKLLIKYFFFLNFIYLLLFVY